jgi:hypothetical protein
MALDIVVAAGHDFIVTEPPPEPTRASVIEVMDAVLAGTMSRSEASGWAMRWVAAEKPSIDDAAVWRALTLLGMIDLTHGPEQPWLYPDDQVAEWSAELR